MLPEKMKQLLTGLAKAVAKNIHEATMPLEARIAALEAAAGIASKAAPTTARVVRAASMPHEAPAHAVGDIVRTTGGTDWRCTGPNRWRQVV